MSRHRLFTQFEKLYFSTQISYPADYALKNNQPL